ncbi:MAG: hypothetical protein WB779_06140 [Ignavibacteriaceae bacterium]|jgi:hypothetical protein
MKKNDVPAKYSVAGKAVICQHCANDRFTTRQAQLNTKGLTFLDLDWANPAADVLICANCGFLHWFFKSDIKRD